MVPFVQELYDKAAIIGNDKKLLRKRLQEGKAVLASKCKSDFVDATFDFENKRLVGKKYYLQWVNRGTNSVGQVGLYKKVTESDVVDL